MAHSWHLEGRMCQAVKLPPCSACERLGVRWSPLLVCYQFICFGNTKNIRKAPQPFPQKEKTMMEGGLFGGTCLAANLLHMEEIAFPCRMHFPMLMMMNLSMLYHLLSLPPAFCRSRAETASRHQGSNQAPILPFLYLF